MKRIAVLAMQGAFIEHERIMQALGAEVFEVRNPQDWSREKDALIIPGGESTAMGKILRDWNLIEPIRQAILSGMPVMGTCAGMILLSSDVEESYGELRQNNRLSTMDISVKRNAYGRQLGSFNHVADVEEIGKDIPMTFIRAPYIQRAGASVKVLAEVEGHIVAARQGCQLAFSFHPELTDDLRVHEYFLNMV